MLSNFPDLSLICYLSSTFTLPPRFPFLGRPFCSASGLLFGLVWVLVGGGGGLLGVLSVCGWRGPSRFFWAFGGCRVDSLSFVVVLVHVHVSVLLRFDAPVK